MKPIKLFEEFINEGSVTRKDFDAIVKVLQKSKYPLTVMYVPKWNEVEIIIGYDAPDKIADDVMDRLDAAKLYSNSVSVAGDSSSYSRKEYDAIERINGGHRDY